MTTGSRTADAKWLVRRAVAANGHALGPFKGGIATCRRCGAEFVDDDANDFAADRDISHLGSFADPCPGDVAFI